MEPFTATGVWWLPACAEQQLFGTLQFDPVDGARLSLIGMFSAPTGSVGDFETELIHGLADNKQFTLQACYTLSQSFKAPGPSTLELAAQIVFVGIHFPSVEKAVFESVSAAWDVLDSWIGRSGFQVTPKQGRGSNIPEEITLTYTPPEFPAISLPELQLLIRPDFSVNRTSNVSLGIKQAFRIEVHPKVSGPLVDHFTLPIHHLTTFLSLGLGQQATLTSLRGSHATPGAGAATSIQIYFTLGRTPSPPSKHPHNSLFTYEMVCDELAVMLANWFTKSQLLKPFFDLYFSTLTTSRFFVETRFLALTQGLETYHRRIDDSNILPEAQAGALVEELADLVSRRVPDKSARSTLIAKLKYVNQLTLRRRLMRLLDHLGEGSHVIFGPPRTFVGTVADLRNYWTHYEPSLESSVPPPADTSILTDQVSALSELCLLYELGFSREAIAGYAKGHPRYDWLRRSVTSRGVR